jgi:hypothetical protein
VAGVLVMKFSILSIMPDVPWTKIKEFLDDYSLIESEKNFFQIAGFPHYENVSSNVLRFFFFKFPLVLKLFLKCVRYTNSESRKINYDISNDNINEVTREEGTEENKRIDIVIKTDKYIIGIENKIEASLNNPFDEYKSYLDKIAKYDINKKGVFLIVLLEQYVKKIDSVTEVNGYILYKDFSAKLKENYPELLDNLGHRYFFLLTEYVSNIDSFEGEHSMNDGDVKKFLEIAQGKGNLAKIQQIVSGEKHLRIYLRNKAEKIIGDGKLREDNKLFNTSLYEKSNEFLGSVAKFHDGILSAGEEYNFVIDVLVTIYGFTISIYDKDKDIEKQKGILNKILPKFEDEYVISNDRGDGLKERAYYKNSQEPEPQNPKKTPIELEDYDKLIDILNQILDSFKIFKINQQKMM